MKSILAVLLAVCIGCSKAPTCQCDPCTCPQGECKCTPDECKCPKAEAMVKPIDDSAKGYVTVIVPPGYKGWALTWADTKIKSQNHYTVLPTSSPLYKERFAKAVPHAPCILIQRSNGVILDRLYDSKAANCCPWKRKKEEKKEEAAPVPEKEDVQEEIKEDEDHKGLYVLLAVAGVIVGTAGAWHYRKTTPSKKS